MIASKAVLSFSVEAAVHDAMQCDKAHSVNLRNFDTSLNANFSDSLWAGLELYFMRSVVQAGRKPIFRHPELLKLDTALPI